MKIKITFILVLFSLFLGAKLAHANVIINEVQIAPTESRFIELYNSSNSSVDLTDWYIQRKTQNGSDFTSLVSKTNFENRSIGPNGYFLISRSSITNSDLILGTLTLTESNTIQIKNENQEVVDKIGWGDVSDCGGSCAMNPTEGKSIQKTSTGWIIATPTSGVANENNSTLESPTSNEDNETVSKTILESKIKIIENPSIKVKILANTLAFTGQPFEIKTDIFGYSNEKILLGKAYWSFGDGLSLEQVNNFEKFNHTYYYPGEYVLILEYYSNSFSNTPDATSKMTIKVIPTTVTISRIGDEKDFFIELTNNATSDIDISGWIIRANNKVFVLPRNTIILAKKQIILSSKITNFTNSDQYILKLFSATGELIFDYNAKYIPNKINNRIKDTNMVSTPKENDIPLSSSLSLENKIDNSSLDLAATPVLDEVGLNENSKNSYFFYFGFIVLLIVSGIVVYYIRQRNVSKVGDDFKIIDE